MGGCGFVARGGGGGGARQQDKKTLDSVGKLRSRWWGNGRRRESKAGLDNIYGV